MHLHTTTSSDVTATFRLYRKDMLKWEQEWSIRKLANVTPNFRQDRKPAKNRPECCSEMCLVCVGSHRKLSFVNIQTSSYSGWDVGLRASASAPLRSKVSIFKRRQRSAMTVAAKTNYFVCDSAGAMSNARSSAIIRPLICCYVVELIFTKH